MDEYAAAGDYTNEHAVANGNERSPDGDSGASDRYAGSNGDTRAANQHAAANQHDGLCTKCDANTLLPSDTNYTGAHAQQHCSADAHHLCAAADSIADAEDWTAAANSDAWCTN